MDLNKSLEWFDPTTVASVTLIGCGAVGSNLAILLARLGIDNFLLYDDDIVNTHNIANQNFNEADVGRRKAICVEECIKKINPLATVRTCVMRCETLQDLPRNTTVFFCVDSIEVRKKLLTTAITGLKKPTIFDFRMGLTSGQFYCITPDRYMVALNTMKFTDEEADRLTPKSACNFELSVLYSIWVLLGAGVSQAVKYWKGEQVGLTTLVDVGSLNILQC